MFGGLAFMVSGNMCCGVIGSGAVAGPRAGGGGVIGSDAMLRLGEEAVDGALDEPHVRPMDFTGRPMKNMVYVAPAGLEDDGDLRRWVGRPLAFATSLPPK